MNYRDSVYNKYLLYEYPYFEIRFLKENPIEIFNRDRILKSSVDDLFKIWCNYDYTIEEIKEFKEFLIINECIKNIEYFE